MDREQKRASILALAAGAFGVGLFSMSVATAKTAPLGSKEVPAQGQQGCDQEQSCAGSCGSAKSPEPGQTGSASGPDKANQGARAPAGKEEGKISPPRSAQPGDAQKQGEQSCAAGSCGGKK